jgi:hypothetical protein
MYWISDYQSFTDKHKLNWPYSEITNILSDILIPQYTNNWFTSFSLYDLYKLLTYFQLAIQLSPFSCNLIVFLVPLLSCHWSLNFLKCAGPDNIIPPNPALKNIGLCILMQYVIKLGCFYSQVYNNCVTQCVCIFNDTWKYL